MPEVVEPEWLYLQGLQSAFVPARDLIGIKVDQTPGWRQDVYDALRTFHRPIATFIFGDGFDYPVIAARRSVPKAARQEARSISGSRSL